MLSPNGRSSDDAGFETNSPATGRLARRSLRRRASRCMKQRTYLSSLHFSGYDRADRRRRNSWQLNRDLWRPRRATARAAVAASLGTYRGEKCAAFCVDKVEDIDYKDLAACVASFPTAARFEPRRRLGTCARPPAQAFRSAEASPFLALLPYTADHIRAITGRGLKRGFAG